MTCISSWEAFPDRSRPLPDYPLTQEEIEAQERIRANDEEEE